MCAGHFAVLDGTEGRLLLFVSKLSNVELSENGLADYSEHVLVIGGHFHPQVNIEPSYDRSKVNFSRNYIF